MLAKRVVNSQKISFNPYESIPIRESFKFHFEVAVHEVNYIPGGVNNVAVQISRGSKVAMVSAASRPSPELPLTSCGAVL